MLTLGGQDSGTQVLSVREGCGAAVTPIADPGLPLWRVGGKAEVRGVAGTAWRPGGRCLLWVSFGCRRRAPGAWDTRSVLQWP